MVFGLSASVWAQQETLSNTTYDSWVLSCTTRADKDKNAKACEIRTTVVTQDEQTKQQAVVAVLAIGRPQMAGQPTQAVVQLPLAALLNVPVKLLSADERDIAELKYVACQPQVCSAVASLTDAQLAALGKTNEKLFISYSNQGGQNLKIEASAKGLSAAFDALNKEK